jgi:hypothetical protein
MSPEGVGTLPRIAERVSSRFTASAANVQAAVELNEAVRLPQQPGQVRREPLEQFPIVDRRAGEGYVFEVHGYELPRVQRRFSRRRERGETPNPKYPKFRIGDG